MDRPFLIQYNFNINYDVIQAAMLGNLLVPRGENESIVQENQAGKL